MTAQARKSVNLAVLVALLAGIAYAANPTGTVPGVVTDEKGRPLEGVRVQVCGIEEFRNGGWVRERRSGEMPWQMTKKDGRFVVKLGGADVRYDIWFDKRGFAPTFLYGISAESEPLKIVLKRGVLVTGTVTRLVRGREKPVQGARVMLTGPGTDLMYEQESFTDHEGRYTFRASRAPTGKKWDVVLFYSERVELDIGEHGPVAGPDFVMVIQARVRKGTVQPSGRGDAEDRAPHP